MVEVGAISGSISSVFGGGQKGSFPGDKYVFNQQSGCFARIYRQHGEVVDLFFEIKSCSCDRTITDVAGGFTMTLIPCRPWDEFIQPDDFIRIFMGDQVLSKSDAKSVFNVAKGTLALNRQIPTPSADLKIPIPNFSPIISGGKAIIQVMGKGNNYSNVDHKLMMYERFFGKIDRVDTDKGGVGKNSGGQSNYVLSGRSFGSIIQDMSLYYNENIPGLNAVNVWFDNLIDVEEKPPSEVVKQFLAMVLTSVPFPQWVLPNSLVLDMMQPEIAAEGLQYATKGNANFMKCIADQALSNPKLSLSSADKISSLVSLIGEFPGTNPLSILSLKGIKNTHGKAFNTSFLNSITQGVFDFVKHLSNAPFNEFWVDLCPGGDPDGGTALDGRMTPTIVMRQRPYDITKEMLNNASDFIKPYADKLGDFEPIDAGSGISSSLMDKLGNAFTIVGPVKNPEKLNQMITFNPQLSKMAGGLIEFTPTLIKHQTGLSNHDKQNLFICTAAYPAGQQWQGQDVILLAESGGIRFDIDSIRRFGVRVEQVSSPYAAPSDGKFGSGHTKLMSDFTQMLGNWYFMNPVFLNGRLICRFLPEARLGVPCRYIETRQTPDNPYPKMELYYTQGIGDSYEVGQPLITTLTVTRGLRYKLMPSNADLMEGLIGSAVGQQSISKFAGSIA